MNSKYEEQKPMDPVEEQEPMDPVVDERLQGIKTERDFAVSDKIAEYNDMMARSERVKDQALAGLDASKKEREQILNDSYELTKGELEDSKEQARKSYESEQNAAYVDYKKASDPYGANAEQMAAAGMSRTGYSESSRVRMYNQYQARVAVARDTFKRAEVEYGKAMAEAKLKNSSALAEIAARTYEKQIEISMSYLAEYYALLEQRDAALEKIDDEYSERWLDMLKVIEAEKAAEEEAKKAEAEKAAASAGGTSKEDSEGGTDTLTDEEIWEMYPDDGPNHKETVEESDGFIKKDEESARAIAARKNRLIAAAEEKKFMSPEGVMNFLKANHINAGNVNDIMTAIEWKKAKKAKLETAETAYDTYNDYLVGYVLWCIG